MSQTCLFVLGMHRSGTSALSGALACAGVSMGQRLVDAADDNPKGFFEPKHIISFNEQRLLPALGRNWKSIEALPEGWVHSEPVEALYGDAKALIAEEYAGTPLFGIKDPRICLLAPFWLRVMDELGIRSVAVLPYRHPLEVAGSLQSRDEFTLEQGVALWAEHVLAAERDSRDLPRAFIGYRQLLENPQAVLQKIATSCSLSWPADSEDMAKGLQQFLEKGLRHHAATHSEALEAMPASLSELAALYEKACDAAKEPVSLRRQMDALASRYGALREFMLDAYRLHWIEPAQLFADNGEGFSPKRQISQGVSTRSFAQSIEFSLAKFGKAKALRFDPLPASCVVWLHEAVLLAADDTATDILPLLESNASASNGTLLFFETHDPQIYFRRLEADVLAQAERVRLGFRVLQHGEAAQAIGFGAGHLAVRLASAQNELHLKTQQMEAAEQQIQQMQAELVSVYLSSSWRYTRPLRRMIKLIKKVWKRAA
jgi:hypothetical protein